MNNHRTSARLGLIFLPFRSNHACSRRFGPKEELDAIQPSSKQPVIDSQRRRRRRPAFGFLQPSPFALLFLVCCLIVCPGCPCNYARIFPSPWKEDFFRLDCQTVKMKRWQSKQWDAADVRQIPRGFGGPCSGCQIRARPGESRITHILAAKVPRGAISYCHIPYVLLDVYANKLYLASVFF